MSELSDEVASVLRGKRAQVGGWASSAAAVSIMRANVRRDTRPELSVRRILHAVGLRYRVDYAPLPKHRRRRADIVFRGPKVAVFIDGCFWHGCPEHFVVPKTNTDYWRPKIARNRERDAETSAALRREGWRPLRFWEHEDPRDVALAIVRAVATPSLNDPQGVTQARPASGTEEP